MSSEASASLVSMARTVVAAAVGIRGARSCKLEHPGNMLFVFFAGFLEAGFGFHVVVTLRQRQPTRSYVRHDLLWIVRVLRAEQAERDNHQHIVQFRHYALQVSHVLDGIDLGEPWLQGSCPRALTFDSSMQAP